MMTILYPIYGNLYVNLTNKCPCACTFCLRNHSDHVSTSDSLWLDHDPTFEELKEASKKFNMDDYKEIVFCGYGEPTEAYDVLLQSAKYLKETYKKPIRLNTNGLGNLVNNKDITPSLEGLVDTISISLNTPNKEEYNKIVRPKFGEESFDAMIDFAKKAKQYVPNVVLSTVDTTLLKEEEEQCAEICKNIGATYRIRPWED